MALYKVSFKNKYSDGYYVIADTYQQAVDKAIDYKSHECLTESIFDEDNSLKVSRDDPDAMRVMNVEFVTDNIIQ